MIQESASLSLGLLCFNTNCKMAPWPMIAFVCLIQFTKWFFEIFRILTFETTRKRFLFLETKWFAMYAGSNKTTVSKQGSKIWNLRLVNQESKIGTLGSPRPILRLKNDNLGSTKTTQINPGQKIGHFVTCVKPKQIIVVQGAILLIESSRQRQS